MLDVFKKVLWVCLPHVIVQEDPAEIKTGGFGDSHVALGDGVRVFHPHIDVVHSLRRHVVETAEVGVEILRRVGLQRSGAVDDAGGGRGVRRGAAVAGAQLAGAAGLHVRPGAAEHRVAAAGGAGRR